MPMYEPIQPGIDNVSFEVRFNIYIFGIWMFFNSSPHLDVEV